jgi:outer membrane protein assembly factor BamB
MKRAIAMPVVLLTLVLAGCRAGTGGGAGAASVPSEGRGAGAPTVEGVAWAWEAPPNASTGMPAADGREVAFTYGHQYLVVLDAGGRERWQAARLGLRDVAPRLGADLVVAATDDGMAAFRRADGSTAWDTPLAARANTPVIAGRVAVTSTWEGQLVGLALADGKVAWTTPLPGGAIAPPAGDGTTVVAAWQREDQRAAGVVAVDATTGRVRWSVPLEPGGLGGPTVTPDGTVVLVAGDLAAHALDLRDGKERWRTPLRGAGSPEVPPVAVDAGSVLVAHRMGGLDLLDLATGERQWQVDMDGIMVRGGPVVGPEGSFAFPLDDGRMVLAGPGRETEARQAPARISGLAVGPDGVLVAATRGSAVNTVAATPLW